MGLTKRFKDWWSSNASKEEAAIQGQSSPPRAIPPRPRYNSADTKLAAALYPVLEAHVPPPGEFIIYADSNRFANGQYLTAADTEEYKLDPDACWQVVAAKSHSEPIWGATLAYVREFRVKQVAAPTDDAIDSLARSMLAVLEDG